MLPVQREHAGVTHAVPEQGCTCIHRAGSLRNLGARTTVTRVDETLLACRRWVGRVWVGEEVIGLFGIPLVFLDDVLPLRRRGRHVMLRVEQIKCGVYLSRVTVVGHGIV